MAYDIMSRIDLCFWDVLINNRKPNWTESYVVTFICPISANLNKYSYFLQNVAVAYVGIFMGGDYLFSWTNFLGLSIW